MPEDIYKKFNKWLAKYEKLSEKTCTECGKHGKIVNLKGWYQPLCKSCYRKFLNVL